MGKIIVNHIHVVYIIACLVPRCCVLTPHAPHDRRSNEERREDGAHIYTRALEVEHEDARVNSRGAFDARSIETPLVTFGEARTFPTCVRSE